eukprot:3948844-Pyramimonas_sp.AAC.1
MTPRDDTNHAAPRRPKGGMLTYPKDGTSLLVHHLPIHLLAVGKALAELGDLTEVFGLVLRTDISRMSSPGSSVCQPETQGTHGTGGNGC